MIIGRPDNKIGNASYPIGKVVTTQVTLIAQIKSVSRFVFSRFFGRVN